VNRVVLLFILAVATPIFAEQYFSPVQKAFIEGYAAYKDGRLEDARRFFSQCDGNYPILQDYVTFFLKKIEDGGKVFYYYDHAAENLAEIGRLKSEPPSPENTFNLAKTYFRARQFKEAELIFREADDHKPFRLSSLEYLATSLARQERYAEAIDIHRQIISEFHRNGAAVSMAMFKIGFLYLDGGDYESAKAEFARLKKIFSVYQRNQVQWYLAWTDYKLGNFDEASKKFAVLEKEAGWRDRAAFWRAKALDSAELLGQVAERFPGSYYGMMAQSRGENIRGKNVVPTFRSGLIARSEDRDYSIYSAAYELDFLGTSELVVTELESIISSKKKRKDINRLEVLELARKNNGWNIVRLFEPYPRAYEKVVTGLAAKNRVESAFIWAVMREESSFRTDVVSKSGAVGLMQLMPSTARRMMLASFEVKDLLTPQVNVEAGVRYLSFLLKYYDSDLFLAAAAYNAGEEAVDRWIKKTPAADEFVEEIPYRETQDYVRKVMRSYWVYKGGW